MTSIAMVYTSKRGHAVKFTDRVMLVRRQDIAVVNTMIQTFSVYRSTSQICNRSAFFQGFQLLDTNIRSSLNEFLSHEKDIKKACQKFNLVLADTYDAFCIAEAIEDKLFDF